MILKVAVAAMLSLSVGGATTAATVGVDVVGPEQQHQHIQAQLTAALS